MTDIPASVMLFAAGFGTRMGALTQSRPKPLIPVAGRPLIDYALTLAEEFRPKQIVANTHYLADQLERHLSPRGVLLSHEYPDILETGGGLKAALPILGHDPVFTMNTDVVWVGPNPLQMLWDAWQPDRMDALLMCVPVERARGYDKDGDFSMDAEGRIFRGSGLVFGGVQIIKTDLIAGIQQRTFSLNLLWDGMLKQNRLYTVCYPGNWCDVGHPGGIAIAEDLLTSSDV